ncbi:MAG: glycine-rich domain-containing protein-like [Oscillatoria sp. SIO1A7]|nr:glycine-rich domain-containing protein-like [Oscillatoria sp. SIO1A7]
MQGSGGGWTREQTTRAIARYLMFLSLIYLYPSRPIVPTPEIDAVWHQHILDTSKYAADCQQLFGRFVHHFPYFGRRGESDRVSLQATFAETQALFEEHFGSEALAEAAPGSEENNSPQPAGCDPINFATKVRPTVDIKIADALQVLPTDWLDFLG